MDISKLKPDYEILNKYFSMYVYLSEEKYNKEHPKSDENPYKSFAVYKKKTINSHFDNINIKDIKCNIDLIEYGELINKYSLTNYYDTLLWAGMSYYCSPYKNMKSDLNDFELVADGDTMRGIRIRENKKNIELLQMLKFIYSNDYNESIQLTIVNTKNRKQKAVIKKHRTIELFYYWIVSFFLPEIKAFPGLEVKMGWSKSEVPIQPHEKYERWNGEKYDKDFVEADKVLKLNPNELEQLIEKYSNENKRLTKVGRKNKNSGLHSKCLKLQMFLQNETNIKKEGNRIISNNQCRFIYDYFVLFGEINEKGINSLPEEYIRTLITNE